MATKTAPLHPPRQMYETRSAVRSSRIAFGALLLRDLVVLRKHLREFIDIFVMSKAQGIALRRSGVHLRSRRSRPCENRSLARIEGSVNIGDHAYPVGSVWVIWR